MAIKESFILYTDYSQHIDLLSDEEAGRLLKAIFRYVGTDETLDLIGTEKIAFSFIKSQLDRDNEKYQKTCEKRKESGKMGGRPKANGFDEKAKKANGFSEKQTKAKKPDNEPEYDNDPDNDISPNGDIEKKPTTVGKENFAKSVSMTNDEYQSLITRLGESGTKRCIEILDNYKVAHGKKYKSDYRAILSWVISEYQSETTDELVTEPKTMPEHLLGKESFDWITEGT